MGRSSKIKNKIKREDVYRTLKRKHNQEKLKKRLEQVEQEKLDPAKKKKRLEDNIPRTLDNTREFDPSLLTTHPAASSSRSGDPSSSKPQITSQHESEAIYDISTDPFASYFSSSAESSSTPKVLITTSQKATRASYNFCEELVGVIPGAEFVRRKKGRGFEMGRIAGWAAGRGYGSLLVVNEDSKIPNAITFVHLPSGPTAYFKISSIQLTQEIYGHARATAHAPELVLNNFATRLGHTVGRMFQTLFPPLPEFQGRQVVTLHNQRDFLFFRRHRYAFRSTEKAALQEIGPRFTLKLRWLKKGLPSIGGAFGAGEHPPGLEVDLGADESQLGVGQEKHEDAPETHKVAVAPQGGQDEYEWIWKPELETSRRTFFL